MSDRKYRDSAASDERPLEGRKAQILRAVILTHIASAIPVGSVTVCREYFPGLSSATIRNELNDLETLGYLYQPHVSAGRVPSERAYRLYADSLLKSVHQREQQRSLTGWVFSRISQSEDSVSSAARMLSEATGCAAVIATPPQDDLRVSCLQLIPMPRGMALLVIITDGGIVRDNIIRISSSLDADALYAISRNLTEKLSGSTLRQVQQMLQSFSAFHGVDESVTRSVADLSAQIAGQAASGHLIIEGAHNILSFPEYAQPGKAQAFIAALYRKDSMLRLLQNGQKGLRVLLGEESGIEGLEDCAIIMNSYRIGSEWGSMAVIGPERIPYEKVLGLMYATGNVLSSLMGEEDRYE